MSLTKIEWTDRTWNPVTGCTKISPGCDHCYMFRDYPRLRGMGVTGYEIRPEYVQLLPERLEQPRRWLKPRMVFVSSMSDLFHPRVPFDFITKIFHVMDASQTVGPNMAEPGHTFQLLTKRPGRMAYFADHILDMPWPPNVWAGTSVESAKYLPRLDVLARVPANVRFVSAEPLLGPLDLRPWLYEGDETGGPAGFVPNWKRLSWVIVGGESGPGARPMHPQWARDIRDACQEAEVPFFFKQWGAFQPYDYRGGAEGREVVYASDAINPVPWPMQRVGKKAAGSLLSGREWKEFPNG